MTRARIAGPALVLAAAVAGGCHKGVDLSEMMKPPARPAELERLGMFVGTWEGTGEMRMPGSDEVLTGKGTSRYAWDADKWLLVERGEYMMGEHGPMLGMGIWSWDAKARKYRMSWFDNYGGIGSGTATYDEPTRTWRMKSRGYYSTTGHKSVGEGTIRMVDDATMEWTFTEWDSLKLMKFMEMKGTSRRK